MPHTEATFNQPLFERNRVIRDLSNIETGLLCYGNESERSFPVILRRVMEIQRSLSDSLRYLGFDVSFLKEGSNSLSEGDEEKLKFYKVHSKEGPDVTVRNASSNLLTRIKDNIRAKYLLLDSSRDELVAEIPSLKVREGVAGGRTGYIIGVSDALRGFLATLPVEEDLTQYRMIFGKVVVDEERGNVIISRDTEIHTGEIGNLYIIRRRALPKYK